jgi:nucleoside-diphosphate-sugar epimerase
MCSPPASPIRRGPFAHVGRHIEWRGAGVEEVGMDKGSNQPLVSIDPRYFRPTEVEHLRGNPAKAKRKLGWSHRVGFKELVAEMMEFDLQRVPRRGNAMAPNELPFRIEGRRIWVVGHRGMMGSALVRRLAREDCKILTVDRDKVAGL